MTSVDPLSEFRAARGVAGFTCSVTTILESLEPETASLFRAAISDRSIQSSAIVRVAQRKGVPLTYNPLRRHRAGECGCG